MRARLPALLAIMLLLSFVQSANQAPVADPPHCIDCGGEVVICGSSPAVCRMGIQCQAAGQMDCCLSCTDGSCRVCLRACTA